MKTYCLVAFGLSVSALGCVTEVGVESAPPAPIVEEEGCGQTLCLGDSAQASLAQAQEDLAVCVPNDTHNSFGDPNGLRISNLSVVSMEGNQVTLRVMLANTYADDVMTYPGTRLRVVSGEGGVAQEGAGQLYGIFACDETDTEYLVEWDGLAPLTLAATATNDLGRTVIDEVELTLQP